MKHKRQNSSSKNGDEKSSKASSCNNDDDSDLDEGKTNCSDSGFVPTSDKTSDNESDVSLNARISPNSIKKKRKDAKHDACCVEGFIKADRSQASLAMSPSQNNASDICKMFASSPNPSSHLLQNALSCNPATVLSTVSNATPTHTLLSTNYSPKDGQTLSDNGDCKSGAINWSGAVNRANLPSSMDPLVVKSGVSGNATSSKQLGVYYNRFPEDINPSPTPLSSSATNIKRNNFSYTAGQPSVCRITPTGQVYFNCRQIKSENYPSLNNYPTPGHTISKNNLYNSFGSYPNAQSFAGANSGADTQANDPLTSGTKMTTYEYGTSGADYKNCDYSSSKMSGGNMIGDGSTVQQYSYGENGFNGHLSSSSEHFNGSSVPYNTYPNDQHSKYLTSYYDSAVNSSGVQHRIPSEYNAITLKQEQQLAGGCGYNMASLNSNYQHAYYENNGSGQIAIASSPNSIHTQTRTPGESHFAKGTNSACYEQSQTPYNYCDSYSGASQYDSFIAGSNEIVPEYYQLS